MGHRRSGRRLGNQRRVSRGCIRSFARRIRIASSDPDTRYHCVHTHVNTMFGSNRDRGTVARPPLTLSSFLNKCSGGISRGNFMFNLCRNFAFILIISVRAENTVFLWICGRDAASEVPSVGKTGPSPSFRHLVQRSNVAFSAPKQGFLPLH